MRSRAAKPQRVFHYIPAADRWQPSAIARDLPATQMPPLRCVIVLRPQDYTVPPVSMAARALTAVGTDTVSREAQIVSELSAVNEAYPSDYNVVQALASVGRELPSARQRILGMMRPRPPIVESQRGSSEHPFDPVRQMSSCRRRFGTAVSM